MNTEISCNRCKCQMERGIFYTRMSAHPDTFFYTVWMKGSDIDDYIQKLRDRDSPQYRLTSYRCPTCGLIEYYANEEPEKWKS